MKTPLLPLLVLLVPAVALPLFACSGAAGPEASATGDGGSMGDAGATIDAAVADAATTSDAGSTDASCTPTVDEAGVTHGCRAGSMGPGDRDDGGGAVAPPSDASPDAMNLPFGASCLNGEQCSSGVCFDFQVRGTFCTQPCMQSSDCPATSPGCNGMGFCRVAP